MSTKQTLLLPRWISHRGHSGADIAARTFKANSTGLSVIFGPNNSGKTSILRNLISAPWETALSGLEFRSLDPNIRDFPGFNESDLWRQVGEVSIQWQRGQASGILIPETSLESLRPVIPPGQERNFRALVASTLQPPPSRTARLVGTNRYLPGTVSITGRTQYSGNPLEADWTTPEGMAAVLVDIAHSPDDSQRELFTRVRDRFEFVTGVSLAIRRAGTESKIHIVEGKTERRLDECGDGLRDVAGLLLQIQCFQNDDLFVDDPGIRLHPGAQRRVLSIIQEEALTRAIWIATHDSIFVAAASATERYGVSRLNAATRVSVVTSADDARDALRDIGWLPADVFVADTLLCCEGPSDKIVFSGFLRARKDQKYAGVVVADLGGVGAVWGRDRKSLLRLADIARSAVAHGRVVALIDRDQHDDHEIKTLTGELEGRNIGVSFLGRGELEDYWLMNPKLALAILDGLALEASASRGETLAPPDPGLVTKAIRQRTSAKASDVLEELCQSANLRWSKDTAARIAMCHIDELAPDVGDAIMKDLADAIAVARPGR